MDGAANPGSSAAGQAWGFVDAGEVAPALNMSFDEALLLQAAEVGVPVLRWYGWASPAATFGYFQKYAEIETWTRIRPLLRRPTGGGLVPHLADWTYAFAVPPGHPWYALRAPESYERMHRWLERAFQECGVPTEVANCCEPTGPGQCFLGWEKFDLLHGGRKIAGAAQRRNQSGLLIQGSIQPVPGGVDRDGFASALRTVAGRDWQVEWETKPASVWEVQARELAATRYEDDGYHRRR
jgi:lipoate-protein ligase A